MQLFTRQMFACLHVQHWKEQMRSFEQRANQNQIVWGRNIPATTCCSLDSYERAPICIRLLHVCLEVVCVLSLGHERERESILGFVACSEFGRRSLRRRRRKVHDVNDSQRYMEASTRFRFEFRASYKAIKRTAAANLLIGRPSH